MVDQNCTAGVIEAGTEAIEAQSLEGVEFHAALVTDVGVPYGLPTEIALRHRRATAKLMRQVRPPAPSSSMPTIPTPRSWAA